MAEAVVAVKSAQSLESIHLSVTVLRYLSPFIFFLCILSALTVISCSRYGSKPTLSQSSQLNALWHVAIVDASYLVEGCIYIGKTLVDRPWWPSQPEIVYIFGSLLTWSVFMSVCSEAKSPAWKPYMSAVVLALTLETAIVSLSLASGPSRNEFYFADIALAGFRILVLSSLCLHSFLWIREKNAIPGLNEESQPLLQDAPGNSTINPIRYGTLPATVQSNPDGFDTNNEADDISIASDSDDEELKEKQRKQIEERGWWAYLKSYSILFSHMLAWKYPRQRKWIVLLVVCLLAERFFVVLVPTQLGKITNRLIEDQGTGRLPWKEFLLWGIYRWLESSAGIPILQTIAVECLTIFSYTQITTKAYSHVLNLSMEFHQSKDTGELVRAIEQGETLDELLILATRFGPMLIDVLVAFWYITYLFDWTITMVVMGVFVVHSWCSMKVTSWSLKSRRPYVKISRKEYRVKSEGISNWTTVMQFNRKAFEESRYASVVESFTNAQFSFHMRWVVTVFCQWLILEAGLLIIAFVAVSRVSQGKQPVGSFITLISYWSIVIGPLSSITDTYRTVLSMLIDAERLLEVFKTEATITDREGATELQLKVGRVEFRSVDFSYDQRKETLKGISFVAEAGKTVALVGQTGSGKTTTTRLISRFYEVSSGSIEVDGQDIRDVTLSSLRECIGIVPQDVSLFNTTILRNLRYARLDASDGEIKEACKKAAIHDKIESFPDGYASKVGERGVKLSGGELQRIAIARVILRNSPIVLLDEATSAVDSETESLIQDSFRQLSVGRTTFVIAHRLSTVRDADLILVFHEGEIVERGTHAELLDKNGRYTQLWSKQISASSDKGAN